MASLWWGITIRNAMNQKIPINNLCFLFEDMGNSHSEYSEWKRLQLIVKDSFFFLRLGFQKGVLWEVVGQDNTVNP
jgi:hypothetical protein